MTMPRTPSQPATAALWTERDAGEDRPGAGEQVAEVLADGDAEVAVEGLEDDVDGCRVVGRRPGQVRDEERPADQAEELDERREHADPRGERQQRRVGVVERAGESTTSGTIATAVSANATRAGPAACRRRGSAQDLRRRAAQDVGVVEAGGERARRRR